MATYRVLTAPASAEQEIKRSRFIALAARVASPQAAKAYIESVRALHPQARHVCSAFIAGAPDDSHCLGFSDDGEPSGTAGRPILAVLQGAGVGQICIAVVRYSGGIKLGTGGLVRAYGGTAQLAMQQAQWLEVEPEQQLLLRLSYDLTGRVEQLLQQFEAELLDSVFADDVLFTVSVPERHCAGLQVQLTNISGGQIRCVVKQ
ncbi:YigZ family protein [Corallincola holothuriorum]|uniref:YigZ family protein n=1 Tax=Corallincola holothuriorum TaxID=2282215 RepID=A0A368N736_9GAMM|nr:YigZ family protein [Corallincola holothuriorum]RCU45391.1 YigZ family protein [Corallincola holothuriorum]